MSRYFLLAAWLVTDMASAQSLLWDNGDWDGSSNVVSDRSVSKPERESWAVDDAIFLSDVVVDGLRWDAILQGDYNPSSVDILVLSDNFEKLIEIRDLSFEKELRGTDRGEPVYLIKTSQLNIHLPIGRYYFGGRTVSAGEERGFTELRSDDPRGATEGYFRGAFYGFGDWTPLTGIFGQPQELAFKVYGETVPEPTSLTILGCVLAGVLLRRKMS